MLLNRFCWEAAKVVGVLEVEGVSADLFNGAIKRPYWAMRKKAVFRRPPPNQDGWSASEHRVQEHENEDDSHEPRRHFLEGLPSG